MSDRNSVNDLWWDVIVLNVTPIEQYCSAGLAAGWYSTLECPIISPVEEPESNMNA